MSAKTLNAKERRYLKQLCHHLNPLMRMGKEGASASFIQELVEQIEHHELIKIRILNNCDWQKARIEEAFAAAEITLVQRIGHVMTVYKENEENPEIVLPRK